MFITGRTQEELFQSIETAVSNGSLDITIYGIHPSFVNEDFGDFIVEQPITTLTFSDLEVISEYAVFCVDYYLKWNYKINLDNEFVRTVTQFVFKNLFLKNFIRNFRVLAS